ncbi:hypothetical protein LMH87_001525 [Akanthomyces muscarius]|uniref:Uncharacterized protein n=1 Tax=Akanthomyces muscarius TaxID=2231603 RepID=A0A9W8Q4H0_AKAMU|nr:hypothetical protein LMH87_001525 [Akanthomyces muscarius]KAJ4146972.1 hypothetical protein LMH87_001525 [Akanthomyces muscarius]
MEGCKQGSVLDGRCACSDSQNLASILLSASQFDFVERSICDQLKLRVQLARFQPRHHQHFSSTSENSKQAAYHCADVFSRAPSAAHTRAPSSAAPSRAPTQASSYAASRAISHSGTPSTCFQRFANHGGGGARVVTFHQGQSLHVQTRGHVAPTSGGGYTYTQDVTITSSAPNTTREGPPRSHRVASLALPSGGARHLYTVQESRPQSVMSATRSLAITPSQTASRYSFTPAPPSRSQTAAPSHTSSRVHQGDGRPRSVTFVPLPSYTSGSRHYPPASGHGRAARMPPQGFVIGEVAPSAASRAPSTVAPESSISNQGQDLDSGPFDSQYSAVGDLSRLSTHHRVKIWS